MEFRHLRHFVTIAERGGISAAARELRITQSALSRQMKALEEQFDVPLFERGAHSLALTPAGGALLEEARKIVARIDELPEKIRIGNEGFLIRIGYAPTLAGSFLPTAISRFGQFHPRTRIQLQDSSSVEMRQGLAGGKLEVILGAECPEGDHGIRWTPLVSLRWKLAVSTDHPLAGKLAVSPADLDGLSLLLYEKIHYRDYWSYITGFFRKHGIQGKIAGEFDGVASLQAAIESNLGAAIVADGFNPGTSGKLLMLPLSEAPESIAVSAGVSAGQAPVPRVLAFVEELRLAALQNS